MIIIIIIIIIGFLQILLRRLLILVVYVAKYTQVVQRTYGIAIVCLFVFLLQALTMPYKRRDDNVLECISQVLLCYAALTGAVFAEPGEFSDEWVGVVGGWW